MKLHRLAFVLFAVMLAAATPLSAQNLELARVVAQKVDRTIRLPGEFLPFQRVSVYARVASFVQQVHVDRGTSVKRGQPLVTLTAPELAAQVAETEARAQAVLLQLAEADAKLVSASGCHRPSGGRGVHASGMRRDREAVLRRYRRL